MRKRTTLLLAPLMLTAIFLLAACQTLPLNGKLPENQQLEKITSVDAETPFAVAPDGSVVALVNSGLRLFHIPTRGDVLLSKKTPGKLAWSPSGNSLAALFSENGKSSIAVYDQFGAQFAEAVVDAQLTDIGWLADDELAAGGHSVKSYKFGSNYKSILYRWHPGSERPVASELRDSTIQPKSIKSSQILLERGPLMDFSSQTPLISYLHPVDPPLFTPYYKLIVKDLASGKELEVATVALESAGAKLSADGEKILVSDGKGTTSLRSIWSDEILLTASSSGDRPALSADAVSWFAQGSLFRKDTVIAAMAVGTTAQFSLDGSRLFLQAGSSLYQLTGLKPAAGALFIATFNEKIQKLRSLRAGGLISPKEYKDAIERIGQ